MTRLYTLFFFALLFAFGLPQPAHGQVKKVTVTVIDAVTQKPVEGAEVVHKALLGKLRRKTNAEGKAKFDIWLVATSVDAKFEINDPNPAHSHKQSNITITLQQDKDVYEYTATIQPESRQVKFQITDNQQQPVTNAKVKLRDPQGNELSSTTDQTGTASFEVAQGLYQKATLTIEKEGFENNTFPVGVTDQTGQVLLLANMQKKTPDSNPGGMLGPTENRLVPNTAQYARKSVKNAPSPVWGPYQPGCAVNPLTDVPEFQVSFVKDEQTLLDYVTESCLGSATGAVNALTDMVLNIESFHSKHRAVWDKTKHMTSSWNAGKDYDKAKKFSDTLQKLYKDNVDELSKSASESYKQTKELLSNVKELAEGPQAFATKCLLGGVKSYFLAQLPSDIQKMINGVEGLVKATTSLTDKLQKMDSVLQAGIMNASSEGRQIFTDFKDITEGIQSAAAGLDGLISFASDPKKILPLEIQMSIALGSIESKMEKLISDCNIRECDLLLRDGISAGQQALTAARKEYAQNRKKEQKLGDQITARQKSAEWKNFAVNPGIMGWDDWKKYNEEAALAEQNAKRIENTLRTLSEYCTRLQPFAAIINDRVNKYEAIYTKGLIAVESCKPDIANGFVKELSVLENSNCGHFFPRPYGKTKSEDLLEKIEKAKVIGLCNEKKETKEDKDGPKPKLSSPWANTWVETGNPKAIYTTNQDGSGSVSVDKGIYEGKLYIDKYSWSGCQAVVRTSPYETEKVVCKFTGRYEDKDKVVTYGGSILLDNYHGTSISVVWTEIGPPTIDWKPGILQYPEIVNSSWRDGRVWKVHLERKSEWDKYNKK